MHLQPPYSLLAAPSLRTTGVHNHPIMIKIHRVLLKSLPLSQIEPISVWRHSDGGPAHYSLIDRSVSAQTALVSYLRPVISVSPLEQM